ncbi:GNAT family N-acetyltransferase [Simiduia agarivorans]|uniref:Histone acetyltransferase HPA2-like acetyltransferase n=1 Tax=Simiduia agarivorans (strain DSM 21679 / JCM 13881 / BCRC 17597 / SA1) TaxID=1117647 RepID=K4KNT3_SIMAS|nr:GNAT family N-acetyltransferase [Simiduia agarivorans]AFV00835.1 histone acetyltransferase HPA2-like acetyltransferase [Simiduia agarivorans SA1 = DSM 21679]
MQSTTIASKPMTTSPSRPKVLNHRASRTAEQLYFLFQGAYRQEARLIGVGASAYFAPLQRDAAAIRLAPSRMVGVEQGGEVIAVAELIEPSSAQSYCLIQGLAVERNHQGKGLAKRVLGAVINTYHKKGVALRVKTAVANKPAQSLYSALKFRTVDREQAHGVDILVMEYQAD